MTTPKIADSETETALDVVTVPIIESVIEPLAEQLHRAKTVRIQRRNRALMCWAFNLLVACAIFALGILIGRAS